MPRTRQRANAEAPDSQKKEVKTERATPAVPALKSKKKQGLFQLDVSEFTQEKLQSLKWEELKQLAKQHGIPANGKRVFITTELLKIAEATNSTINPEGPATESASAVGYVLTSPTKRRKIGIEAQDDAPAPITPPNNSALFAGTSFRPSAATAGEVTKESPRTPRRKFGPSAGRGPLSGYHPTPRRPVFVPPGDEEMGVVESPRTPTGQIGRYYEAGVSPSPAAEEDGQGELPQAPPPPPANRRPNFKPGDPRAAVWDKKHAEEVEAQKAREAEQAGKGKGKGKERAQGTLEVKPMARSDPLAQLKALDGPSRKEIRSIRRDLTFCVNDAAAMPEEMDLDTRVAEEVIEELQQAARDVETSRSRLNQVGRMLGDIKRKRKRHD